MKEKLLLLLVIVTTTIFVMAANTMTVTILQQHPQIAQASPCPGNSGKEYSTGYQDGAIQAHKDFKTGDDLGMDQHQCTGDVEYCNGYNRGYNDEQDFLG